jgi:ribonuclease E
MANKMLIDATHPEETRVVVLRGNRVEEFDFETAHRKQLRGNIYLAKVTRVEPSLQAAFVEYGGNRHGFLAFSEIHPDYYQIPVADRQALLEAEARAEREQESDDEESNGRRGGRRHRSRHRRHERQHARRDDPERTAERRNDRRRGSATRRN